VVGSVVRALDLACMPVLCSVSFTSCGNLSFLVPRSTCLIVAIFKLDYSLRYSSEPSSGGYLIIDDVAPFSPLALQWSKIALQYSRAFPGQYFEKNVTRIIATSLRGQLSNSFEVFFLLTPKSAGIPYTVLIVEYGTAQGRTASV
jgi:hypothetical protein